MKRFGRSASSSSAPAAAACRFDAFGTIINPQDPTCGGVELRYTRSESGGTNIPLGYDVPFPVESLEPVDGFRSYRSLFERHQALDAENAAVADGVLTTDDQVATYVFDEVDAGVGGAVAQAIGQRLSRAAHLVDHAAGDRDPALPVGYRDR